MTASPDSQNKNGYGGASSHRSTWVARQVLAVFWPPSHISDSDLGFGCGTFRWNHAVSYPLEAKSLLLTS
nr:MAG TPA: hypothetical protein [Caudoviricetes sp.]